MNNFEKIFFRAFRILVGKRGIYAEVMGKGNKFTSGVYVNEKAILGKYSYYGPYAMINNSIVGNYCSIGPSVKIGQGNHSANYYTTFQKISSKLIGHSLNTSPAVVGNDVWCGANVVIMQGVKIGDGAIIGANAVVTQDIPSYAIAVGVPAKVIKYRFDDEKIKMIIKSKWFEYDLNKAIEIISTFDKKGE